MPLTQIKNVCGTERLFEGNISSQYINTSFASLQEYVFIFFDATIFYHSIIIHLSSSSDTVAQ